MLLPLVVIYGSSSLNLRGSSNKRIRRKSIQFGAIETEDIYTDSASLAW
jgi:hypothetical protein